MQASFSPATAAADLPGACSLSDSAGVSCGVAPQQDVGAGRHIHCADLDDGADYFQAQGLLARAGLEESRA